MLNQVLEVSSGTCQQFVEDAVKIATFLDFQMSQDSAATYCRCGGNLCSIGEKNWKSVHIFQSYYQTSMT